MDVFQQHLAELIHAEALDPTHSIVTISTAWDKIQKFDCTDECILSLECREAIHDAVDEQTRHLLKMRQADVLSVLVAHITEVIDELENQNSPLNTISLLNSNKEDTLLGYYFERIRPKVVEGSDTNRNKGENREERAMREGIWLSLVFRMLLWLLLHDFDKSDIRVVPSDLKGSRMPVFIG